MIGQDLRGYAFLDAFGGSGIMGLEASSRGADPVVITEKNPRSYRAIVATVKEISSEISVRSQDAYKAITQRKWDIIFLDPPYSFDIQPYLQASFLQSEYLVIAEIESKTDFSLGEGWQLRKERVYGNSKLIIFERDPEIRHSVSSGDNP